MSQAVQTDRGSEQGQGSQAKTVGMIAAIVVLLGAAVYLTFFRSDPEARQSDDPADSTPYICLDCQHRFDLTPAGYVQLHREGGVPATKGPNADVPLLRCPKCSKFSGTRAFLCPKDGTAVPSLDRQRSALPQVRLDADRQLVAGPGRT